MRYEPLMTFPYMEDGPPIRVRVVGDPECGPPEHVRQSWFGVEFNAAPCSNQAPNYRESTAEDDGKPLSKLRPCWEIGVIEAVAALEEYDRHEAAQWWRDSGIAVEGRTLAFPRETCEPVDGTPTDELFWSK